MTFGARGFAVIGLVPLLSCGPPPFLVHVTYRGTYSSTYAGTDAGEIDVEHGSPVLYQGVQVGHVQAIALRQDKPSEPAVVEVTLAITSPTVVLRERDRFHLASHRGVDVIEVEPWPERSPPLAPGGTIAGVPPLITRVEDSVGAAIESIESLVVEAVTEAREAFEEAQKRAREQRGLESSGSWKGPGHAEPSR